MIKFATIIGARPQFIKAATVSRVLKNRPEAVELIIHTGQHYDANMSGVFFKELDIPKPDYNLEVGSGSHGFQTGQMLIRIEEVLDEERPDYVILYGDTNSTIAGALAAAKLHLPVAHIEAGLRSFNKKMPEEINRIATDHISDFLFAPTKAAVAHLKREGLASKTIFSGDVMYDSVLFYQEIIEASPEEYLPQGLPDKYYLATIHRPSNTDHLERLKSILEAFSSFKYPVIFPAHPRLRKIIEESEIVIPPEVRLIEPVGYLQMIALVNNAEKVLTDSGGLQKEAFILKKPCITLRAETEWVETLKGQWNILVGADPEKIREAVALPRKTEQQFSYYGNGKAAELIVDHLVSQVGRKN